MKWGKDMKKKTLREKIKNKLSEMDKITYEHRSYLIANRLYRSPQWRNASVVGITVSRFPEVETWQIIRKGWEQGKTIVVPKCDPINKSMRFYVIHRFDQLETVFFGLFEPIVSLTEEIKKEQIDLLIVPGLGFSPKGFRIGFGGGYYDRYLVGFTNNTMSLAFSEQIFEEIPYEHYDQPVKQIITENHYIDCK